jgi:hypothetical protein
MGDIFPHFPICLHNIDDGPFRRFLCRDKQWTSACWTHFSQGEVDIFCGLSLLLCELLLQLIGAASIPFSFLCGCLFGRVVAKTDLLGIGITMREGEEGAELPMNPLTGFCGLSFPLIGKIDGGKSIR